MGHTGILSKNRNVGERSRIQNQRPPETPRLYRHHLFDISFPIRSEQFRRDFQMRCQLQAQSPAQDPAQLMTKKGKCMLLMTVEPQEQISNQRLAPQRPFSPEDHAARRKRCFAFDGFASLRERNTCQGDCKGCGMLHCGAKLQTPMDRNIPVASFGATLPNTPHCDHWPI